MFVHLVTLCFLPTPSQLADPRPDQPTFQNPALFRQRFVDGDLQHVFLSRLPNGVCSASRFPCDPTFTCLSYPPPGNSFLSATNQVGSSPRLRQAGLALRFCGDAFPIPSCRCLNPKGHRSNHLAHRAPRKMTCFENSAIETRNYVLAFARPSVRSK
jgi:hypothetical protein